MMEYWTRSEACAHDVEHKNMKILLDPLFHHSTIPLFPGPDPGPDRVFHSVAFSIFCRARAGRVFLSEALSNFCRARAGQLRSEAELSSLCLAYHSLTRGSNVNSVVVTHDCILDNGSREYDTMPPIVSIVGKSDAGKTTLLEKLVAELKARGYRIGTIKHNVHGFDIDHRGKDSWRHKQAGAHTVAISSPTKVALVKDVETEETLNSLATKYFQDVDIILTEGYKKEDKPKIEVFRSQVHETPLCKGDEHLVALVSDTNLDLSVPRFEVDDIKGLAGFVEQRFLVKSSQVIR